ncbi:putative magnesium transporter [Nymphaea thermarum]|nr:putative magnesium transporter [Nymphaea thermarum]
MLLRGLNSSSVGVEFPPPVTDSPKLSYGEPEGRLAMTLRSQVGSVLDADNLKGLLLAGVSSAFIGSSFILKKKGLKRAGAYGDRAGSGGYGYLLEPLWWAGMVTMIGGEIANFVAYIFAPAVLVTPLGALSIIVSAVLAHFMLNEKLDKMGMLGCLLCIVGSTVIVLHAPSEHSLTSVTEIWDLATQPAFLLYTASVVATSLALMLHFAPRYGQTNIMVYLGICSLVGSLTVMSIKAVGIAIKLTIEGTNQAGYPQTWIFATVAVTCIVIQLNYLNMACIHHFLLQFHGLYVYQMENLRSKEMMDYLQIWLLFSGRTTLYREKFRRLW